MVHTLFIIVSTLLITAFFSIAVILASFKDRSGDAIHRILRIWARCILAVSRIRVTVKGLSNIDPARSYIYMSNHQSYFDIFVILAYLPAQSRWLAKKELFRIPIFGYAMQRAGYISIDRSNRKSALKSLNNAAKTVRDGVSVLIFPEGTRSQDGSIRPFKNGGFILAVGAGVPIVPVIIHGTWPIMPKNRILIKPGDVVLEIQKSVETAGYNRKTKGELLEKVRNIICESFEKGKEDRL